MKTIQPLLFLGLLPIALLAEKKAPLPEGIPGGYKLVYSQDFEGNGTKEKSRLWFTTPDNWNVPAVRGKSIIEFKTNPTKYKYKVRSPLTIGLVRDMEVKDFVLEAELQQTGKEYGHRDMCVFYGFKDRSHFYYTHIASVTDPHAHNCFIVNDKPRTKISHETTKGHKRSAKLFDAVGNVIGNKPVKNADSGIFVRGSGKSQLNLWCWPCGSGQLWAFHGSKDPAIRKGALPKVNADKPVGEWKEMEITMKGETVTVVLNGKTVIDQSKMPGVGTKGPIVLQHHGGYNAKNKTWSSASALIQFRNLSIKDCSRQEGVYKVN